jgi:hypothetical protein
MWTPVLHPLGHPAISGGGSRRRRLEFVKPPEILAFTRIVFKSRPATGAIDAVGDRQKRETYFTSRETAVIEENRSLGMLP